MDIIRVISDELNIRFSQTEAAVKLIDEGCTIPFIARYRKEATGSLNDEILRNLGERLVYLRSLQERKNTVITAIEQQGKLTTDLKVKIEEAMTMASVEDLYRPYKPKRKTRGMLARQKGLKPLSDIILIQDETRPLEEVAAGFINPEKEVMTVRDAISGAKDIIAEDISDNAGYRSFIRQVTQEQGNVISEAKDPDKESVYEMYYHFSESVSRIQGHRILAINRGEKEKFLTVKISAPEEQILRYLEKQIIKKNKVLTAEILKEAIADSYERLIEPSIEREVRNLMTEKAQSGAITVFGKNLRQLLMQPPIAGRTVLGWDPAFRTGCKLAIVDETGKILDKTVIYPTPPQNKTEESAQILRKLIKKYHISLISVGNGTASRESESFLAGLLPELDEKVEYVIVNESGASVYSASKLAADEFPEYDVGVRSAASIARRLQDPLAELVKIDPRSIGVGQYQHDMDQKRLSDALSGVVEDCVNRVGVDLNTASIQLLSYISGINRTVAENIVKFREENGRFNDRKQLLKVKGLGPKAFEQCAGFLRIPGGENALDSTSVHPESYKATFELLGCLGVTMDDVVQLRKRGDLKISELVKHAGGIPALSEKTGIGKPTLKDILEELEKPGRDPREDMPKPVLKSDVLEMKDLKPGMILKGTVRNAVDFGVFVDIGVHQDGLVHISRISDSFIRHPLDVVSVGDIVDVKVLDVDEGKKRIQLTMKLDE